MEQIGAQIPEIWFERAVKKIGLPTWAGAAVVGAGPFVLLGLISGLLVPGQAPPGSTFNDFLLNTFVEVLYALVESLVIFYIAKYLRREIGDLLSYAKKMQTVPIGGREELDLSNLSSTNRILVVYVAVALVTGSLFTFGQQGSLIANLAGELPFLWSNVLLATLFWTFGYSMYSVYRMGRLPLKLKPYTQDRTLGLKPFASASLNSTLLYFGFVTFLFLVVAIGGALPFGLALSFLVLYPMGLLLFLLPLWSLHSKLLEEKAKKAAWLEPRATAVLERLESEEGTQIDQAIAAELTAIDKIQRDIQQIRTWPFDTGIVTRLAAVLLSVSAILLSASLRDLLHF